jgi:ATP-dependent DNA helicase RecG
LNKDRVEDSAAASLSPEDNLTVLPGIGPKTGVAMAAEGFHRVLDLLLHLPRRYEDRSALTRLDGFAAPGQWILIRGRARNVRVRRIPGRRLSIVDGVLCDQDGEIVVVWFNQPWISRRLNGEHDFYFYGQVREVKAGALRLTNPEIEEVVEEGERIVPVYPRIGRFGGRRLRRLIGGCANFTHPRRTKKCPVRRHVPTHSTGAQIPTTGGSRLTSCWHSPARSPDGRSNGSRVRPHR